jgi:excisionase family DNA binding protein
MGMILQVDEDTLRTLISQDRKKTIEEAVRKATEPEYITTAEAAKLLCLSRRTLNGWRYARRINYVKIGGRVLFRLDELREFIQRRTIRARGP